MSRLSASRTVPRAARTSLDSMPHVPRRQVGHHARRGEGSGAAPAPPPRRAAEPATSSASEIAWSRRGLILRPLTRGDLVATTALHAHELPNGLFPALGQSFLRAWHATFLSTPHAQAAVVVDERADRVAGFLLLASNPPAHVRDAMSTHRLTLARRGVIGLARRPNVAWYFTRTRARRYTVRLLRRSRPDSGGGRAGIAVVQAVVTDPDYRGHGIARALLDWAERTAAARGADHLALVTDADTAPTRPGPKGSVLAPATTDQGAVGLYDRLGWRRVDEHHRDGRTLVEFRRSIRDRREPDTT